MSVLPTRADQLILIVEDHRVFAEAVDLALRGAGYDVRRIEVPTDPGAQQSEARIVGNATRLSRVEAFPFQQVTVNQPGSAGLQCENGAFIAACAAYPQRRLPLRNRTADTDQNHALAFRQTAGRWRD